MPLYEYWCQQCQRKLMLYSPTFSDDLPSCPQCGNNTAKRLIGTGSGIIFKGSGFYQTDYRSDSYKSAAKKEIAAFLNSNPDKDAVEVAEALNLDPRFVIGVCDELIKAGKVEFVNARNLD